MPKPKSAPIAQRIRITGRVQGVGFRPFVSRLAQEFQLAGWVRNCSGEVEIHAEGTADRLDAFRLALTKRAPPLAQPEPASVEPAQSMGLSGFALLASAAGATPRNHIPPDYFVCDDCLAEMADPRERRYRYPFISCTQCGPRYTIIDRLPYDRPNTGMADFELCPACRAQYQDPTDRRYHAQPLACPECGPKLSFVVPALAGPSPVEACPEHSRRAGAIGHRARKASFEHPHPTPPSTALRTGLPEGEGVKNATSESALSACLEALRAGLTVAVKGVGGYHLLCDAENEAAVRRLRERKPRPHKPLAVLVPWRGTDGLALVDALAEPSPAERELLRSPLRPIVLVNQRPDAPLAPAIAPGLNEIGLMLPYSPLHHLLADGYGAPLVATSANLSGEPVLTDAAAVEARLGHVADAFLHHNRPIRRPADDSVFRSIAGQPRPLRLGRGSAPIELTLPFELAEPMLAVGSDLKNTVALGFGQRVVISPHIGDLDTVLGGQVFEQVIGDLIRLYGAEPRRLVCDAHPDYRSSRWATARGLPVQKVFHHPAHASALVGEHDLRGETLIFTWDGTGYGEDHTVWGGETLLGRPGHWRRVGSLRPFRLPGGERASREPWRGAAAACWEAGLDWPANPKDSKLLRQIWERRINSPVTSSAGRLFDAAAALIGLAQETSHEGQAAMNLEAASEPGGERIALPLARDPSGLWLSDWGVLLPALMDGSRTVRERGSLFHASLADAIVDQAERFRADYGVEQVGLAGGVFQNRLLTDMAKSGLEAKGFWVFLPVNIPTNDAGLSYGQIIEAGF
ncbi:carbamoyltransferase HypF [Methylomagnum sp.]